MRLFPRRRVPSLRAPQERAGRVVLLVGRCWCGRRLEFVRGCSWVVAGGWDKCTHGQ